MGIQRIPGQFRQTQIPGITNTCLSDNNPVVTWTPFTSFRTLGATQIETPQIQPPLGAVWKVISYSIRVSLVVVTDILTGFILGSMYGEFGPLDAFLLIDGAVQTFGANQNPFVNPMMPFPQDTTNRVRIWDPSNDPLPPLAGNTALPGGITQTTDFSQELQLPVPVPIHNGEQVGLGLWMSPSLIGSSANSQPFVGLTVANASYSIVYDDGNPNLGSP